MLLEVAVALLLVVLAVRLVAEVTVRGARELGVDLEAAAFYFGLTAWPDDPVVVAARQRGERARRARRTGEHDARDQATRPTRAILAAPRAGAARARSSAG